MTFQELQLLIAIKKCGAYRQERHRQVDRLEYAIGVQRMYSITYGDTIFPFAVDEVLQLASRLRKNWETQLKVDVAELHGCQCFWKYRGKGECSVDAECGHIVPAHADGQLSIENCIIECKLHNRMRHSMTIDEFLMHHPD